MSSELPTPRPGPGTGPRVVDARGLRCPLPVIRLAAVARDVPPGTELTVLTTDPAARYDVPAWARMRGHEVTSSRGEGGQEAPTDDGGEMPAVLAITVRVGGTVR